MALQSHGCYDLESELPPEGSVLLEGGHDALLGAAYPELTVGDRRTRRPIGLALSAYVRTITTWDAPFQQFLRQDPAVAEDEVALPSQPLRAVLLEAARVAGGARAGFVLLGLDARVQGGNHLRTLRRERARLEELCLAIDEPLPLEWSFDLEE